MVHNDDLGLTLSLNFPPPAINETRFCNSSSSLHFNLIQPSLVSSPSPSNLVHPTTDRTNSFASSEVPEREKYSTGFRVDKSFLKLKGIDVNRMAAEAEVSSPNSTVSSISGKRSEERGMSDEDDGDNSRKKLRLSKDQSAVLEESFKEHTTLNPKQKQGLAKKLGLRPRQVEVWFQNRRARTKLKQTEVECELMKRCCENLTVENRRLEKELQELKAFKLSPQFYMQRTPPTTLTMCPSCEPSSTTTKLPFNPWPYHGSS